MKKSIMRAGGPALVVALLALVSPVLAQPTGDALPTPDEPQTPVQAESPPVEERAWAKGVSAERQEQARKIASEGVEFFAKGQCAHALEKYGEAIKLWDHPAMRYNMAECLMRFGQLVQAYENLEKALRYGPAPFDSPAHYPEGLLRRKLLLSQLAQLEVESDQPGVSVTLDGKPLFVGPGNVTSILLPGQHQLVASKDGHLTITRQLLLAPDKLQRESLALIAIEGPVRMEQRWHRSIPWLVVGTGAALTLAGVPVRALAQSSLDQYDEAISQGCDDADGCTPAEIPDSTRDLKSSAETRNKVAIGLFVAGGATLVAGMAMVLLNQPRAVSQAHSQEKVGELRILPVVGADHLAVLAGFSF